MSEDPEEKANAEARARRDAYLAGAVPVSTDAPVAEAVAEEVPVEVDAVVAEVVSEEEPEIKELNDFTQPEETDNGEIA